MWSATGYHEDLWTPPLRGEHFTLYWRIDESALPSWGFELDAAESWREEIPFPLGLEADLPLAVVSPDTGCRHHRGDRNALLWLLLLLLPMRARRRSGTELSNLEH